MLIRHTELEIARRYPQGKMRCPTHLSVGQECTPAVLSVLLDQQDLAVSTHRSHAHYLGKGGDLPRMIAEIYGKVTGCSKGRGGSMHLIDLEVGFMGSTAIVGNTIPIGVGLALAKQVKQEPGIAVVYLGDGAIEEGVFYEAANFAAVRNLPVLFVCENNLYSVYSSLTQRQPNGRAINQLAQSIGLHSASTDGNSVYDAFHHLSQMVEFVSTGKGPGFIELSTYRWLEHCGPHYDNDIGYRSEAEFLEWQKKDPIHLFQQQMLNNNLCQAQTFDDLEKSVLEHIRYAFDFAEQSEFPQSDDAYTDVFAGAKESLI